MPTDHPAADATEWPPRFILTWQGLFNLCIGHIQNGNKVGEEVLRRVAVHLESLGLKTADLDQSEEPKNQPTEGGEA